MIEPNVYYFNPTCELAVANGSFSYMPPLLLQEMERDLSILPFIFATEDDFVLTDDCPSKEFIQKLYDAGFKMPVFRTISELESVSCLVMNSIIPWGWSPAAHFKLKTLKERCSAEFIANPVFNWQSEHQLLFERITSFKLLQQILRNNPPHWFISNTMTGKIVFSCEEIEESLKNNNGLVIKAPVSSSGRGIQIIRRKSLSEANRQWISGVLKQQNYLIAEPLLEKILDFSFQFQIMSETNIQYLGYSVFETNSNGQYSGTLIHPDMKELMPEADLIGMFETTAELICEALQNSVYAKFHVGFLGVDSMLFKNNNQLFIQPCIEVNSRMNMGILSKFLEDKLSRKAKGKFELFYGKRGEFKSFVENRLKDNPLQFQDGKLISGFLPLIEPAADKKFGAYLDLGAAR